MENSQEKSHSSRVLLLLSTAKMAAATLISRVLGLVREQLIAAYFGASGMTDAFFVAYRIPNLLRDLFAEGAFSSAFVPVFTNTKIGEDKKKTQQVFRSVFWSLLFVTLVLSGIIFLGAKELVSGFAPSFINDPEKFQATVLMVRVVSPFLCFISMSALLMGVLNTYNIFFLPAVTPAFLNVSVILSIIYLSHNFILRGLPGIYSVAVGILTGGLLQFLLQVIPILKKDLSFKPTRTLITPEVKSILKKMGPGLLGFSLNQINLLINTILATSSVVGAMSWLNFSFRLFQFPTGILSVSLGNSHLVHFSKLWKGGQEREAKQLFQQSITYSLFLMIPVTVVTIFYSEWLVNIVFERGVFLKTDTLRTAEALALYALALPFIGIQKICIPLFYTVDKEKVPVITSGISILINILFAYSLIDKVGFKVLALSMSIATFTNTMLQLGYLKKFLSLNWSFLFNFRSLKVLIASILPLYFLTSTYNSISFFEKTLIMKGLYFGAQASAYLMAYALTLMILGERKVFKKLIRKLKKK